MIYGYCRVSTTKQNLARQEANIRALYPEAIIYSDVYSGKTNDRPMFQKLLKKVEKGDVIVFDEVSRMSRNAQEGFQDYIDLFDQGISLKFIKEPHIDTDTYKKALETKIPEVGNSVDLILEGINAFLMELAKEQIKLAFEQAEKERLLLSNRTKEGMVKGRTPGRIKGVPQHQKKEASAKKIIRENSRYFGGSLNNANTMKLAGVSSPTFYKYVREMKEAEERRQMDITDYID